jgi:hypothetical protein
MSTFAPRRTKMGTTRPALEPMLPKPMMDQETTALSTEPGPWLIPNKQPKPKIFWEKTPNSYK